MSSMNLIVRKTKIIIESKEILSSLDEFVKQLPSSPPPISKISQYISGPFESSDYCQRYIQKLNEIKKLAIGLEQIIWALNSNKEHIKYIVKVFTVPEKYQRSEFSSDPNSVVPLRQSIIHTIDQCEEVIVVCRLLRGKLSGALIKWFIGHF